MTQRVLVVEDDGLLREAVDLILTQAGFNVATTSVGRGALDLVTRFQPHLVLIGVGLPDISGLEVLDSLRKAGLVIPIVMMTADSRPDTVKDVMAMGGNGYLLKPFEPRDLIARVRLAIKTAGQMPHSVDD